MSLSASDGGALDAAAEIDEVDEVEVVDESDRLTYIFRGTAAATAEQLADKWSLTGEKTWSSTRPATEEDLAAATDALANFGQ